jgi:hypothetical protein
MSEPMLKLQIIARAEFALAEIRARRAASRSAFFAVALVFLLLGLAMMTLAVYHALAPHLGPAGAALTVALIDTIIGLFVVLAARRAGPSENEEKLAREIRDMAYTELNSDIQQVKNELNQLTGEVKRIRAGITSFTSGAVGTVGPLFSFLFKSLKRD